MPKSYQTLKYRVSICTIISLPCCTLISPTNANRLNYWQLFANNPALMELILHHGNLMEVICNTYRTMYNKYVSMYLLYYRIPFFLILI